MITCKKCGRVLNLEDISCPVCGTPTADAPQLNFFTTEQQNEQTQNAPPFEQPPFEQPFEQPGAAPDFSDPQSPLQFGYTPPPDFPHPDLPPNVSYVPPPPQYGYAPPPDSPPQYGYAPPPPNGPPQYGYAPPPPNGPPQYGYTPPSQYGYTPPQNYNYNAAAYNNSGIYAKKPKSKVAAGLLAILLGYGIYNFYLKYYLKAAIQLTCTLISGGFMMFWGMQYIQEMVQWSVDLSMNPYTYSFPNIFTPTYIIGLLISIGVGLWQLVEGILILIGKIDRDGAGNPIA